MNSPEKKNVKTSRMTKPQLQRELNKTKDLLAERETSLIKAEEELAAARIQLEKAVETNEELTQAKADLEKAKVELVDMSQDKMKLKQEVNHLNSVHQDSHKENESLRAQLQAANEEQGAAADGNMADELKHAKQEAQELRGIIEDLESKNTRLQEDINNLQKVEEAPPEDATVGKTAFRIDFYPHQGKYQGKVEHLLTQQKKAFSGLDQQTIGEFINDHLPQLQELEVLQESEEAPAAVSPEPETARSKVQLPVLTSAKIHEFKPLQEQMDHKARLIAQNKAFQLTLTVNPEESIDDEHLPCPYKIAVYAKRLGDNHKHILGEQRGQITSEGELITNIHCLPLPAGFYRFIAFGTYNIEKDKQKSIVSFQESSVFNVA